MGRSLGVTPGIAQFMHELERVWDAHQAALLVRRDPVAATETLTGQASVVHIPAMTGAAGRPDVGRFYAEQFLPYLPGDLALSRVSRTVDRWRLVDEVTVSFTHDRELPWLLPAVGPTGKRAEVLAVAVVGFERALIRSVRVLWDQASLTAQLGVPFSTGQAASGPAR